MKDFEPQATSSVEAIESLKSSAFRAATLARLSLEAVDEEPLIRLRVEKGLYLDCLKRLHDAVVNRRGL